MMKKTKRAVQPTKRAGGDFPHAKTHEERDAVKARPFVKVSDTRFEAAPKKSDD